MGVGQLIRNVITVETDPTVANFTKSLTSSNTILTAVNAATGTISASVLPSYVDDVLNFANLAAFPVAGETSKIYVTEDTNKTYRWSGSVYVEISSSATAGEALKLTNARTISTTGDATYSISFDGSANVSSAITLANTGVAAGTYNALSTQVRPFTVDAKGRITGVGTPVNITPPWSVITGKPTTLDGFGITGGTIAGNLAVNGNIIGSSGAGVKFYEGLSLGSTSGNSQILCSKAGISEGNTVSERIWLHRKSNGTTWESVSLHNGITVDSSFGIPGSTTRMWWDRDLGTLTQSWGDTTTTFFSVNGSTFRILLTTPSTSPTTGAITAASLGITGAIFANTVSANSYNLIPVGRGAGGASLNTTVGVNSLLANTTGNYCSAFGVGSLTANTTGNYCSAFGVGSLTANTTGNYCSAFGVGSLTANTTGNYCSAFGVGSLTANTTGSHCSAFGVNSLLANTTGSYCSAFGVNSLLANTTGVNCSAFGVNSLLANTTGTSCSAFGADAGRFQSDGVTGISVTNNSCFFGMNTKGTQNATNEQVFGFNATGNGSNTVTIGDSNITNNFFRGALSLNGTQVISTRRTGWVAPTGTPTRTTFATSTVTLSQLAETVKALIDDLSTHHGLIGS